MVILILTKGIKKTLLFFYLKRETWLEPLLSIFSEFL